MSFIKKVGRVVLIFCLMFLLTSCSETPTLSSRVEQLPTLPPQQIDRFLLLSKTGSNRGTAYPNANKIVRVGHTLYCTFLDYKNGVYNIIVAEVDLQGKNPTAVFKIGESSSNHGGATLLVDHKKRLHVLYGCHATALKYRVSNVPLSLTSWTKERVFNGQYTYPSAVVLPNNDILVALRQGNRSLRFYRQPASLDILTLRDGAILNSSTVFISNKQADSLFDRYASYSQQLLIDKKGTVHLVFLIHERPKNNPLHDPVGDASGFGYGLVYVKSRDNGKTWEQDDGNPLSLPANMNTITLLAGVKQVMQARYYYQECSAILSSDTQIPVIGYTVFDIKKKQWQSYILRKPKTGWERNVIGYDFYTVNVVAATDKNTIILAEKCDASTQLLPIASWQTPHKNLVLLQLENHRSMVRYYPVSSSIGSQCPNWLSAVEKNISTDSLSKPYFALYTSGAKNPTDLYLVNLNKN